MTKYSDIEIQTAKTLLKRGFKWITRGIYGAIIAYKIKPDQEKYISGNVICSDFVPIFESIRCGDEPVSLESIVHPQILDEAERKYLAAVIKPFRDGVRNIRKIQSIYRLPDGGKEYIKICMRSDEEINFPYFRKDSMYKRMELGRKYTLEELGL